MHTIRYLLFLMPAWATAVVVDSNWFLRLDGKYYAVNAATIQIGTNNIALGSAVTTLANCGRASGASQVVTADRLTVTTGSAPVYLASAGGAFALDLYGGIAVLHLASATGDIICNGAQTPPRQADRVFDHGFE